LDFVTNCLDKLLNVEKCISCETFLLPHVILLCKAVKLSLLLLRVLLIRESWIINFAEDPLPYGGICQFEDENICGFRQDTNDDFDWIVNSGASSTSNTGPTFDHSYQTQYGKLLKSASCASLKTNRSMLCWECAVGLPIHLLSTNSVKVLSCRGLWCRENSLSVLEVFTWKMLT